MRSTFDTFDWRLVAEALDVRLDVAPHRGTVMLRAEPDGRVIAVHDNGGEFNSTIIESDGSRWEPDFSVAYEAFGVPVGPITLAYRIACHAQDRQIDYRVDLDLWPADLACAAALRTLAAQIEADALQQVRPERARAHVSELGELWTRSAGVLAFERVLRCSLGIELTDYAAVVAGVWAAERPRQFAALGRAIAAAPIVGTRLVRGSRE